MRTALLLGSDHTTLGATATVTAGRTAAALSRGRFPKGYPHIDPNEDAVVVADLASHLLLAVADGHDGSEAAEVAITAIAARLESLDLTDTTAALRDLTSAVVARAQERLGATPSRTALSIVLVDGRRVATATFGDTSVILLRAGKARRVSRPAPFLGPEVTVDTAAFTAPPVRPGDRVVAATDGLLDFLGRNALPRLAAIDAPDQEAWVRAAVEAAFDGGAGDNIAVGALLASGRHLA